AIPTQASNGKGPQVIPTVAVQDAQPLPMPPVIKSEHTETIPPKNTSGLDVPPPPDKQQTPTTTAQPGVAAISDVPPPTQEEKRLGVFFVPSRERVQKGALAPPPNTPEKIGEGADFLGGGTKNPGTEGAGFPKDEGPATDPTKLLETTPLTTGGAPAAD